MRIQEEFAGKRITEQRTIKKKYFIVSEGAKTEPDYFKGLSACSLCQNISLINLLRDYRNANTSHPQRTVEFVKRYIKNSKQNSITAIDLTETLYNCKNEHNDYFVNEEFNEIIQLIDDKYDKNDRIELSEIDDAMYKIFIQIGKNNYIDNLISYIKRQNSFYVHNVDEIDLVIDRDPHNFSKEQFEDVIKSCESNGINLYISNPCFELWLYLHFEEIENENRDKLLRNEKLSNNSKRRYIDKRLSDVCGYKKNKLDFLKFENKIKDAIQREKNYEENLNKLEYNLGTNVGKLVNKLIQ